MWTRAPRTHFSKWLNYFENAAKNVFHTIASKSFLAFLTAVLLSTFALT